MSEPRPSDETKRYDLFLREGAVYRPFWRLRDRGIMLTAGGLEWNTGGIARRCRFSDIVRVRLETAHIPRSGDFGNCVIRFHRGLTLVVSSLDSWGTPDDDRIGTYVAFVRDLHAWLDPNDRTRIRFLAGNTEGRYQFTMLATILAAIVFAVLPLGLLAYTGEMEVLLVLLAGIAFVCPLVRIARKNKPRNYAPDRLTDDLFP
ncbi:MAG: hypothetical protein GY798_23600 [Hyphomicrobiales bacterium]|nr:hypothetical protein [Hyphomicrobiales bacterium]